MFFIFFKEVFFKLELRLLVNCDIVRWIFVGIRSINGIFDIFMSLGYYKI